MPELITTAGTRAASSTRYTLRQRVRYMLGLGTWGFDHVREVAPTQ